MAADSESMGRLSRRRLTPVRRLAGEILGTTVAAAIPLHSRHPALLLGAGGAEILLFAVVVATGSTVALAAVGVAAVAYLVLYLADRRAVLAVTVEGDVLLAAGRNGRPRAAVQPVPRVSLPDSTGIAASVVIEGRTWWVDRSGYRQLSRARAVRGPF